MAAPTSSIDLSWRDYGGEPSNVGLWVTTLTAANIVAQTTLINNLATALSAVTLGEQQKQTIKLSTIAISADLPTSPFAQRESKWLLRFHAATSLKKFTAEVPCADLALLIPNTEMADMTGTEFANLKTAWELVVRDPDDNELTILDSAQFVGRKL